MALCQEQLALEQSAFAAEPPLQMLGMLSSQFQESENMGGEMIHIFMQAEINSVKCLVCSPANFKNPKIWGHIFMQAETNSVSQV